MLENKNVVNRVLVFQKIVRLTYQDGSNMVEHMNGFQGLINQTTSLEVPLADNVLHCCYSDPFRIAGRR